MKLAPVIASFVVCAVCTVFTASPAEPAPSPAASFLKLRLDFAATPLGSGWEHADERDALRPLYDASKPQPFIDAATKWLEKCPVDAEIHMALAAILMKTGDAAGAARHLLVYYGLVASILESGDGKSLATGYKVIAIGEEYTVLRFLETKFKGQALVDHCDVMDVTLDGRELKIYFDATIPLQHEAAMLGGGEKK